MVSKRIKFIASLIDANDKVLDVGTDHALLPIYLVKNNIAAIADGSDISKVVLDNAQKNVTNYNLEDKINLYLSDGIKDVDINKYNTLVITGMGYYTIKGILEDKILNSIDKLIIQANNNHEELRRFINSIGYKIIKDYYIFDKNKAYLIILAKKGDQKLSNHEYMCGLFDKNNTWYYQYIIDKYEKILKNVPIYEQDNIKQIIDSYNDYLSKERTED